jgi:hypothetical protein
MDAHGLPNVLAIHLPLLRQRASGMGALLIPLFPPVRHVTKVNLLKYVNDCIRNLLISLAPDYELARADPSLLNAQLCLGDANYMDAGRYFQVVSTLQTGSSFKLIMSICFRTLRRRARPGSNGSQSVCPKPSLWTMRSLDGCSS